MKKSSLLKIITFTLLAGITSCGSSDSPGTIFIPDFTATWPVEGDEDYFMNLQYPSNDTKYDNGPLHSGEILGEEQHNDGDDPRHNNILKGIFNGLDIEFTIERENGDKIEYKGKMTPISETNHFIVKISLNSPQEGAMVLSR
ncbi:hypothetical protein [Kriegella aquimaris]|uniref:Secreted protein n=1 Tax=Kriegella aquimaris TaxID=192904 RepID=A0A1G9LH52_9FLAO|nr:hypothetical protein [Kriegella aquimaris]SDL61241.1 hypothetical protein SAMN04488514_10264 [Kriegella aquimaris]